MAELHIGRQLRCCAARPRILYEIRDFSLRNGIGFRRFMKKAWMPMGYKKQMLCRFCVTKLENESATERVV